MDQQKSKTDFAKLDAMRDDDIVYDENTGSPWTEEELEQAMRQPTSFVANGLEDFWRKKKAATLLDTGVVEKVGGNKTERYVLKKS